MIIAIVLVFISTLGVDWQSYLKLTLCVLDVYALKNKSSYGLDGMLLQMKEEALSFVKYLRNEKKIIVLNKSKPSAS